ncbi:MAG: hypothetical protein KKE37_12275 [Verrucomicrobia bacterium]|nr:hypothetical protein [Verrucomicrobiota bacterium]MBU4430113.1 hypothetical protein [Verrucomicrobiota bacterium]MCG2680358.1 hypothetical protein [Kiritimatiellia bacterium]
MKKRLMIIVGPILVLVLGGCATPDQRVAQLQTENQSLMNQTKEQEQQIATLTIDKQYLTTELNYYSRRSQVLDREKAERIQESQNLRKGVRQFTDEVMKIMRDNYKKMEIVDYIGSELYQRQTTGNEVNQVLVDMLHPLPADGTLIGGRVYVTGPTRLTFCLLRPTADQKELIVTDMSRELTAQQAGEQQLAFEVPMAAHKGDLIGVFCPEAVAIPYDDLDTGYVIMSRGAVKMNSSIDIKPVEGRNKRAYSFGVMGFLDKE